LQAFFLPARPSIDQLIFRQGAPTVGQEVKGLFDSQTFTMTYVVYDTSSKDAIIIDPVLDLDVAAVKTSYQSINTLLAFLQEKELKPQLILETHAHADHVSGAHELKARFFPNIKIAIGKNITTVQKTFKQIFNMPDNFAVDGRQFDLLLADGQRHGIGSIEFEVLFTPGHTPACASYYFAAANAVFTGDALFMPDYGTGRCDFPDGDAKALYHSITTRLYQLPESTRVFVGHDYQPNGRPLKFETTIGQSKAENIQLQAQTSEQEFVDFRTKRDATLSAPKLLYPSVQVNIAAGEFPPKEQNGKSYLKLPVQFGET